jgi:hypothetical protein
MSTNDTSGKNIVPQILQFHAEPESTSSKFFSICPIQKNRKTGIRGGGDGAGQASIQLLRARMLPLEFTALHGK